MFYLLFGIVVIILAYYIFILKGYEAFGNFDNHGIWNSDENSGGDSDIQSPSWRAKHCTGTLGYRESDGALLYNKSDCNKAGGVLKRGECHICDPSTGECFSASSVC